MAKNDFNPGSSLDFVSERRTAGDWFDGEDSAMRAFSRCEPFSPEKLCRETVKAIRLVTTTDILSGDGARLQTLHQLAERWSKQLRASQAFRVALRDCIEAGCDPHEIRKVFDAETSNDPLFR